MTKYYVAYSNNRVEEVTKEEHDLLFSTFSDPLKNQHIDYLVEEGEPELCLAQS